MAPARSLSTGAVVPRGSRGGKGASRKTELSKSGPLAQLDEIYTASPLPGVSRPRSSGSTGHPAKDGDFARNMPIMWVGGSPEKASQAGRWSDPLARTGERQALGRPQGDPLQVRQTRPRERQTHPGLVQAAGPEPAPIAFPSNEGLPLDRPHAGSQPSKLPRLQRRPSGLAELPPAPESPWQLLTWMQKVLEGEKPAPSPKAAAVQQRPATPEEQQPFVPKASTRDVLGHLESLVKERWKPPPEEPSVEGPLGLLTPRTLAELPLLQPAPPPPRPAPLPPYPDLEATPAKEDGAAEAAHVTAEAARPEDLRRSTSGASATVGRDQPRIESRDGSRPSLFLRDGSRPLDRVPSSREASRAATPAQPTSPTLAEQRPRSQGSLFSPSRPGSRQWRAKGSLRPDSQMCYRINNQNVGLVTEPEAQDKVFQTLADELGELPADLADDALRRLGYRRPNPSWIDSLLAGQRSLKPDDFSKFAAAYQERFRSFIRSKLESQDKSGFVSEKELRVLLRREGVTPMPSLVKDLTEEFPEENRRQQNWIGVEEYIQMSNHALDRFGFARAEIEELQNIFQRCDRDHDGRITATELRAGLSWAGFKATRESIVKIRASIGLGMDSPLQKGEFYHFMQIFRDKLCEDLQFAIGPTAAVGREGLLQLFERLGYLSFTPEVIHEAIEECHFADKSVFRDEDVFTIFSKVREKEEMLQKQHTEATSTFAKFARGREAITGVELQGAIRFLGYPQTLEQVQEVLSEFDIDQSGELDGQEFTKVIRCFREELVMSIRQSFIEDDLENKPALSQQEVRAAFLKAGLVPSRRDLLEVADEHGGDGQSLDLWRCLAVVERHRTQARNRQRASQGFTEVEARKFRRLFDLHGDSGSGDISKKNVADVVEELLPEVRSEEGRHLRSKALLKDMDGDREGFVDLKEFLRMMRVVQDDAEEQRLVGHKDAIKASGWAREQVKAFRKVYHLLDEDVQGEVTHEDVSMLLKGVVTLGVKTAKSLLADLKGIDQKGDREMSFPQFLHIMRNLQDRHWAGIDKRYAALVRAARQEADERAQQ